MNSVVLIGRLTRDPELRFTAGSGRAVATFTIAVDRPYSKNNETDFFRVVVWGKPGENCANYLAKGRLVGVQGRIQNNNYQTSTGEKRYTTEIVADRVQFLEWGNKRQDNNFNPEIPDFNDGADGFQAIEDDDDIPF
ncbi:single-stranded DNA-binding protein [Paramaledivibacter caminithermalis]|jgi:single-strand DNA-binding protein|uniref:Single-stranded DNA-binding protein n=1 Tax=Paramaledivibacter caminithermalis (strain DSM 15212 / CIP 107654 / DViRD3) TaxID=1121301 RepID=A0A1M6ND92_PARC5|nr:single-stranded DNA-binding protein [Paramaledivibacter caminithermalis]SHJ93613.1 single-strand binding protein [Paramaledivibacter caminithermalis DSM 15212]